MPDWRRETAGSVSSFNPADVPLLDITTRSICPTSEHDTLPFPQQALARTTSPLSSSTSLASPTLPAPIGSVAPPPSGRSLSCPLPRPDRLSPEQAGDCLVERWVAGDRANAANLAINEGAEKLFSVIPQGPPRALGCMPTSDRVDGNPNPYGVVIECKYQLVGGGSVSVFVSSTPSAGAVIFATTTAE